MKKKKILRRLESLGLSVELTMQVVLAITVAQSMNWVRKVAKAQISNSVCKDYTSKAYFSQLYRPWTNAYNFVSSHKEGR